MAGHINGHQQKGRVERSASGTAACEHQPAVEDAPHRGGKVKPTELRQYSGDLRAGTNLTNNPPHEVNDTILRVGGTAEAAPMSFLIVWGRCGEDRWRGDTSLFQVTHQLVPSGVIFVATLVSNDHIEALVGFQGRGCADGVQPDFCHPLILEVLLFQWPSK